MGKCGRIEGNAPLLWDPLTSPFVLGRRIGGSPDFDRFVVSHDGRETLGYSSCRIQVPALFFCYFFFVLFFGRSNKLRSGQKFFTC